jgi:hypothetical protein
MLKQAYLVVFAGLAGACGPSATGPTTVSGTAPPAAAAEPCPSGDALNDAARAGWGKGEGVVTASCLALRAAGETLWLIDGTFEPGTGEEMSLGMWTALITPGGEVRWAEGEDDLPYGAAMRSYTDGWTAADLDGDGTDEVLYVAGYDHGGYMESQLVAASIAGGKLAVGEAISLSSDNSAAVDPADPETGELHVCDGAWELVPAGAGRQVAVTYSGDQCEKPGRHVFSWNGAGLVAAGP